MLLSLALVGPLFSNAAVAGNYADVISVDPVFLQERPVYQQVCERVRDRNFNLLGAGIGGVAGHQFGKGRGRTAMTVVGALVGSQVGNNTREECHMVQVNAGGSSSVYDNVRYRVTFEYGGQTYCKVVPYNPGSKIVFGNGEGEPCY